jgi:hypothetical protein
MLSHRPGMTARKAMSRVYDAVGLRGPSLQRRGMIAFLEPCQLFKPVDATFRVMSVANAPPSLQPQSINDMRKAILKAVLR